MSDTTANPDTQPSAGGSPPPSDPPSSPPGGPAQPSASPAAAPEGGGTQDDKGGAPAPAAPAKEPAKDDKTTLAEGGGEDDPAAQPRQDWPDNWRDIMAGGDDKALSYLKRYKSPATVANALMATRQKISTGELLRSKPEDGDDEALNEWRAQAGIPENPEGYLEKLPDGLVIGEDDKELVDGFLKSMHEADAPPGHVHQALAWYYDTQEKLAAERFEADRANRAQNEDALRAEWGPEYRANLNGIHSLFNTYGNQELLGKFFGARFPDGTPVGDDPEALKFLAQVSAELLPHGTIAPIAGERPMETIQSEIAALEKLSADDHSEYWKGEQAEAKQTRLRELYDLREKHQQRKAS